MMNSVPRRRLIFGGALLATVVASVWPRSDENAAVDIVGPAARGAQAPRTADPALSPPAELPPLGETLERPAAAKRVADLFAAKSWIPPAPKPAPGAPSAPSAPPFPYTVVGGLADNNVITIVFSNKDQYFVLRAGEVLADTYRLDEVNSNSITVTYLPLGQKQVLPLGTPN